MVPKCPLCAKPCTQHLGWRDNHLYPQGAHTGTDSDRAGASVVVEGTQGSGVKETVEKTVVKGRVKGSRDLRGVNTCLES